MASGSPLSMDLRVRAVDAYENGEGTLQEIADRFCIGRTTLCDLLRLYRYAGTLEPSKTRGHKKTDDVTVSIRAPLCVPVRPGLRGFSPCLRGSVVNSPAAAAANRCAGSQL